MDGISLRDLPYSGLMFAARITLPHFSVSSAMSLPKSGRRAREHRPAQVSNPRLDLGIGESGIDLLVELVDHFCRRSSRCTDAIPRARLEARHKLSHGRNVRECLGSCYARHSQRAQLACSDWLDHARRRKEHDLHLSADEIGQGGRPAAIGHIDQVDASHHLEQLTRHVWPGSRSRICHINLAGMGLGISDELGNRLGRNRWMDDHHVRRANDAPNWRDVPNEAEIKFVVKCSVDGTRCGDQK
jgi:hypothetical protein